MSLCHNISDDFLAGWLEKRWRTSAREAWALHHQWVRAGLLNSTGEVDPA